MACMGSLEDPEHIFRKCKEVVPLWQFILSLDEVNKRTTLSFQDWLRKNIYGNVKSELPYDWNATFAICLWCVEMEEWNGLFWGKLSMNFKVSWIKSQVQVISV